ncbi:MAG: site-specific integrase [bacterium]|nr:site-specific integrase [bacterium]
MAPITKYKRKQIIEKVDDFLKSKKLEDLTPEELEHVSKSLLVDELKSELKGEVKQLNVDIQEKLEKWLDTKNMKSEKTRVNYEKSLDVFFDWMGINGNDVFSMNALDADSYVLFLFKQGFGPATIRNRVAAVSSFFTYLVRGDIIPKNYFKGVELPKIQKSKTNDEIPDDRDMEIIEKALWEELEAYGRGSAGIRRQARNLLAAVCLIKYHGFRVSGVVNISIDKKGHFLTFTKGNDFSGITDPAVLDFLDKLNFNRKKPFDGIPEETLIKSFERFIKRLVRDGKVKEQYSLHDLRHHVAVKRFTNQEYPEYKDIYALQHFLNHQDISTTQKYLVSRNLLKKG